MVIRSTVPVLPLTVITSPTAYWFSSRMKNPPMMGYVRQANIAHGPQQVNNAASTESDPSGPRENANLQSKLLEENSGERLDIGATGASGRANPAMAPLGKVDRTKNAGG